MFSDSGMGSWRVESAIPGVDVVASGCISGALGWGVSADGVAGEGAAGGGACLLASSGSGSGSDTAIGTGTTSRRRLDGSASSLYFLGWRSARTSLRSFSIFSL